MLLKGYFRAFGAVLALTLLTTIAARAGSDEHPQADRTAAPPQYMLLLFESTATPDTRTPEEHQAVVEEYKAWARALHKEGKLIGGDKLDDARATLAPAGGRAVELPKNTLLAGYFIIVAATDDEALAIARSCPHHKYGGTIEIRKIQIV